MKRFIEFLMESASTYSYRIRVAGTLNEREVASLESILDRYGVESFSRPTVTPIQESPMGFDTKVRNTEVSIIDIETAYPASLAEMKNIVSNVLMTPTHFVAVENAGDDDPEEEKNEGPILEQPYPETKEPHQYGDDFNLKTLAELGVSKDGEGYRRK